MRKWTDEAVGTVIGTAIIAASMGYVAWHVVMAYLRARGGV